MGNCRGRVGNGSQEYVRGGGRAFSTFQGRVSPLPTSDLVLAQKIDPKSNNMERGSTRGTGHRSRGDLRPQPARGRGRGPAGGGRAWRRCSSEAGGSAPPGNRATASPGPLRALKGPSVPGLSVTSQEEPGMPCPWCSPQLVATATVGTVARLPRECPPLLAGATVWACPASLQGQPAWAPGLPGCVPPGAEEGLFKGRAFVFTQACTRNAEPGPVFSLSR